MLLNKVSVCRLHLLFVRSPHSSSVFFSAQHQERIFFSSTERIIAGLDVLFHHHTATELLLLCGQTQLLHVRACAGGRAHVPHRWLRHDREGAMCCRLGLLLEANVRVRVGLLADVQTSLEKVSSGGHGGHRGRVAG